MSMAKIVVALLCTSLYLNAPGMGPLAVEAADDVVEVTNEQNLVESTQGFMASITQSLFGYIGELPGK